MNLIADYAWSELSKILFTGWGDAAVELSEIVYQTAAEPIQDLMKEMRDAKTLPETNAARTRLKAATERLRGNVPEEIERQAAERAFIEEQKVSDEHIIDQAMYEDLEQFAGEFQPVIVDIRDDHVTGACMASHSRRHDADGTSPSDQHVFAEHRK